MTLAHPLGKTMSHLLNVNAYYMYLRYDSALLSLFDSPSIRATVSECDESGGVVLSGGIEVRGGCECGYCRRARGLEPLTTAELTRRREAKRRRGTA